MLYRRIIMIVAIVIVSLFGCSAVSKISPETDGWTKVNVNTINRSSSLNEWFPQPFEGKGNLTKIWSRKIIAKGEFGFWNNGPVPDGLLITSDYEISDTKQKLEGLLNLNTGVVQGSNYPGPTDGIYVFGDTYKTGLIPGICWQLDNNDVIWEQCCNYGNGRSFQIVNNNLLYITSSNNIRKVDPKTGVTIWEFKPTNNMVKNMFWCKSNKYLFIVNTFSDGSTKLFRINPNDGTIILIKIKESNKIIVDMIEYKEFILLLTSDNTIIFINTSDGTEVKTIAIKTEYFIKDKWSKIEKTKDRIFIRNWKLESKANDSYDKLFMLDPNNVDKQIELDGSKYSILNKHLISYEQNMIKEINPDNFTAVWSINDERKGSTKVVWLDWRGVLVISDETIACYVPSS